MASSPPPSDPQAPTPPRVILIGMMGAGKTRVGRLLAQRLGWHFWDNDEEFLRLAGSTTADLFSADGPDAVHAIEARVLREGLHRKGPSVVCAPGSIALDPASFPRLPGMVVVWLRATPATLATRVDRGPDRPYLGANAEATIAELSEEREPGFAALADLTLDVDNTDPDSLVRTLIGALHLHPEAPSVTPVSPAPS